MKAIIAAIITSSLFLVSCKQKTDGKTKDYFYSSGGGLGLKRVPLIKPYEAVMWAADDWRINFETPQLLELSIHNVKSVNVLDSVIILYASGDVSIRSVKYPEGWFVIIPNEKIEEGFEHKKDFLARLNTFGITDPSLHDLDSVYSIFKAKEKLDWPNINLRKK